MFVGVNARVADFAKLNLAKEMYLSNVDMKIIYQKTKWFIGLDGFWRFEIPDCHAKINSIKDKTILEKIKKHLSNGKKPVIFLKDILKHKELYEAYPDIANEIVILQQSTINANASYGKLPPPNEVIPYIKTNYLKGSDGIYFSPEQRQSIIHELQHMVQGYEGFPMKAFNTDAINNDKKVEEEYLNHSCEQEARLTESRTKLGVRERKAQFPLLLLKPAI